MSKDALKQACDNAVLKFLISGGKVQVLKPRKLPKQLTAGAGSTKHCGRTNKFGHRI